MSLDELIDSADDFDLIDAVFVRIGDKYGGIVADEFTGEERVVMLTWHSRGIVGNGAFGYLFSGDFPGDPGYKLTAAAFDTLGAPRAAIAFRAALALFPDSELPADIDARMAIYEGIPKDVRDEVSWNFLDACEEDETEKRLAQFIRNKRQLFQELFER